ncbi:MAG: PIN domain-containing protein [Lachnospiraceae bacterium]|nr:PIN domain-containing protein [Lachnospiraceae bacterium]
MRKKSSFIILLTGDGQLRKAAQAEGVAVIGTISILDQLYDGDYIAREEYLECLKKLQQYNGGKVRLPGKELEKRIEESKIWD